VYKQERALGSGTTSTVWLARHAVSGHVVAVKSIAKGRVDAGKWSALWAEVDVLRKVSCALSLGLEGREWAVSGG
jgi:serine/threonine protein kinase